MWLDLRPSCPPARQKEVPILTRSAGHAQKTDSPSHPKGVIFLVFRPLFGHFGPVSDWQFQYWTFPADRARKSSPDLDLLRSNFRPARQTMPDGQVQYSTCPG
jgi:hypothetical protein